MNTGLHAAKNVVNTVENAVYDVAENAVYDVAENAVYVAENAVNLV